MTLKDTPDEWYSRQPLGYSANWEGLKKTFVHAFVTHFRPLGFQERLMKIKMAPGKPFEPYYGRVQDLIRKWTSHQMPDSFVVSILVNALYPTKFKLFVKEAQPATIAVSVDRAKVWEECHYDQFLSPGPTMI